MAMDVNYVIDSLSRRAQFLKVQDEHHDICSNSSPHGGTGHTHGNILWSACSSASRWRC